MNSVSQTREYFETWIAGAADGLAQLHALIQRRRKIELIEQPDGSFLVGEFGQRVKEPPLGVEDGALAPSARIRSLFARSTVSIALSPARFVFRPLELPSGAEPFIEGVVRSQIDRLTPWSPNEAEFGWSRPVRESPERITLMVAASSRADVSPLVRSILAAGADRVLLSTRAVGPESPLIPILTDRRAADRGGDQRLQRRLTIALAVAAIALALSYGSWIVVGGLYAGQLAELHRQSADRRAELMNRNGGGATAAIQALDARKVASPSAVMTLEVLSKILPDHVYLTELRVDNGKVQILGVAKDAAILIGLLEQSHRFTRATFYAPTVRNPDGDEIFHVEGHIEPSFAVMN
jgi:general secretion pathway protein L